MSLYAIGYDKWYVDVWNRNGNTFVRQGKVAVGNSGWRKDPNVGGAGIAINPNTNHVFVANTADGTVSVLGANGEQIATIPVGPDPFEIAVNPTNDKVYVTLRAINQLFKFDDIY